MAEKIRFWQIVVAIARALLVSIQHYFGNRDEIATAEFSRDFFRFPWDFVQKSVLNAEARKPASKPASKQASKEASKQGRKQASKPASRGYSS